MYNNQGYPGGAQSPPLHHPVPQHPIQLPADAVPPPQTAQQYSGMSAGYQNPAPQGGHARTASYEAGGNPYLGLFNDSTTQMGFQVGKNAVMAGSEFVEQRLHKYVSVSDLKLYFQVSNSYVMKKLFLILFPYRHKSWARIPRRGDPSGAPDGWATPSEDINAPDLYIPLMATVTLVVLWSYLAGFHGDFRADGIVNNASKTAAYGILDMLILKLGSYLLNADSNFLDLVAYSGYKFVPVIICTLASTFVSSRLLNFAVFFLVFFALAFFMLRSLRNVVLPVTPGAQTYSSAQRKRKIQFLFLYCFVVQFVLMWFMVG